MEHSNGASFCREGRSAVIKDGGVDGIIGCIQSVEKRSVEEKCREEVGPVQYLTWDSPGINI